MLKISEMAKLANTTRRTLIFYDEQALFKPAKKSATGYRYYDYRQLYDLMLILGLRHLGLPLADIKAIQQQDTVDSLPQLQQAQLKVTARIKALQRMQQVIDQKLAQTTTVDATHLYQPTVAQRLKQTFWCSRAAVSCTEAEIAQLFSEFYRQLDDLTVMDTSTSGFLTDLSVKNPSGYADAGFRIIKATIPQSQQVFIPLIEKPAGRYACILVENNVVGINHGLTVLKAFCHDRQLTTPAHLWQLNVGDALVDNGASKYGWLEYAIEA